MEQFPQTGIWQASTRQLSGASCPHQALVTIERDKELFIWTHDAGHARRFFGFPDDRPVRVLKEQPETPAEKAEYRPSTKLFAVLAHEPRREQVVEHLFDEEEMQRLLRDTNG